MSTRLRPATPRIEPSNGSWSLVLLAAPTALGANSPVLLFDRLSTSLEEPLHLVAWVAIAFGLAAAVATPMTGALLHRYGATTVLVGCGALVATGSLLVVLAPSLSVLVCGRLAQGAGGAGLFTLAVTLADSTRVRGALTAANGALGAAGPLVGELLSTAVSWRVALSLSAVSLVAIPRVRRLAVSETGAGRRANTFDGWGAAAFTILVTALVLLPRIPAPAGVMTVLAFSAVVIRIRVRPHGFVPLTVLRNGVFLTSSFLVLTLSTSYFALLYLFPRLASSCCGWEDGRVGVAQMSALLAGSFASWCWTSWSRVSWRVSVAVPVLIGGLSIALALANASGTLLLIPAGAVFAATSGLAALITPATESAPAQDRTTTAGLVMLAYLLGGAFGPNLASAVLSSP